MRRIGLAVSALSDVLALHLADAQQAPKIAKIGYLDPVTPAASAHNVEALRQGLRELGYVEGKTFVLESRYGEARLERLSELARQTGRPQDGRYRDGHRCGDCGGQTVELGICNVRERAEPRYAADGPRRG